MIKASIHKSAKLVIALEDTASKKTRTIRLTIDEARALRDQLDSVFYDYTKWYYPQPYETWPKITWWDGTWRVNNPSITPVTNPNGTITICANDANDAIVETEV